MRKYMALPVFALLAGAAGAVIRSRELKVAFDAEGLAIPMHPVTLALIIYTGAVLAIFLLLALRLHRYRVDVGYEAAFRTDSAFYPTMATAAGLILLVSALVGVYEVAAGLTDQAALFILAILAGVSAFSVMALARRSRSGEKASTQGVLVLTPVFLLCLWLILVFQDKSSDPIILDYAYELFAIVFSLMALYFAAGFAFRKPKMHRTLFFSMGGVYFSVLTLADGHDLFSLLTYLFLIIFLTAGSAALLKNARLCEKGK